MIPLDLIGTGLAAVLSNIPDPISVISRDFRVLWANNVVLRYLKIGLEGARGRLCYEALFGKPRICGECPIRMVFDSGRPAVLEKRFADANGSINWREVRAYPIRDATGSIVAAIRIGFDITHTKRVRDNQGRQIEELERALRAYQETASAGTTSNEASQPYCLSPREAQVLRLLTKGLTNKQIAQILCVSDHTVKSHVAHVFNKLGVTRRAEAAARAFLLGFT